MSEANAAVEPKEAEQPENPFAGFASESFDAGERVEDAKKDEEKDGASAATSAAAAGVDDTATADGEQAGEPPVRKAQTAQERINELTRARREAEREAADLRRRLEAVEARLPEPKKEAVPAEEQPKGPPKPEDFEFGELDSAYIAAVVDWRTEEALSKFQAQQAQERAAQAATAQQVEVRQKFEKQVEQGRQKYADFDEVVVQGAQDGTWPLSETLGVLLVESEVGEDIAYELASKPDEALRVFRLPSVEQARWFGRLEAKFSAARAAATGDDAETPATTKAPKAPPPVQPARGAGGRFQAPASSDDFLAFEKAANQSN